MSLPFCREKKTNSVFCLQWTELFHPVFSDSLLQITSSVYNNSLQLSVLLHKQLQCLHCFPHSLFSLHLCLFILIVYIVTDYNNFTDFSLLWQSATDPYISGNMMANTWYNILAEILLHLSRVGRLLYVIFPFGLSDFLDSQSAVQYYNSQPCVFQICCLSCYPETSRSYAIIPSYNIEQLYVYDTVHYSSVLHPVYFIPSCYMVNTFCFLFYFPFIS